MPFLLPHEHLTRMIWEGDIPFQSKYLSLLPRPDERAHSQFCKFHENLMRLLRLNTALQRLSDPREVRMPLLLAAVLLRTSPVAYQSTSARLVRCDKLLIYLPGCPGIFRAAATQLKACRIEVSACRTGVSACR